MNRFVYTVFATLGIFAGIPFIAHAADTVYVDCRPQDPLALTTVYCRTSGLPYMDKLHISWFIGENFTEGAIGQTSFSFRTAASGTAYMVQAQVRKSDGTTVVGSTAFQTRSFGTTRAEARFRTITKTSSAAFRVQISPPYPRAYTKVTLSLIPTGTGKEIEERRKIISEAKGEDIQWYERDNNTVAGNGTTLSIRLASGLEKDKVPFRVTVKGLGEVSGELIPQDNFVPENDNFARAGYCAAQTLDRFANTIESLDKEVSRTLEQLTNLQQQLEEDFEVIMSFMFTITHDIERDAEMITAAAQTVSTCNGIVACLRAGARQLIEVLRVYTGATGLTARRIARFEKAIQNISTFKETVEELKNQKIRMLESVAAQSERQLQRCEQMFQQVNTHGL